MHTDHMNGALTELIMSWYRQNKRDLPWRENKEPYRVWLSEMMLQQTRVEAVKPYYKRFLAELPTIGTLAAASDGQLYKLWEGLGYYSRARNLRKAAEVIMRDYGGAFPQEYEQILSLPGIGPYTAGAIASICFDAPTPAVDGNVLRVIARIEELDMDVSLPDPKKAITKALARIYPESGCGDFTQGLMELGATVCIPNGKPKCGECPVAGICKAFQNGTTEAIPVKKAAKARRCEDITVFVLVHNGSFAIQKRGDKGLLAGLWEFPNCSGRLTRKQAVSFAENWSAEPQAIAEAADKKHIFTHIEWHMRFYLIPCKKEPKPFLWVNGGELREAYAIPAAFRLPAAIRAAVQNMAE